MPIGQVTRAKSISSQHSAEMEPAGGQGPAPSAPDKASSSRAGQLFARMSAALHSDKIATSSPSADEGKEIDKKAIERLQSEISQAATSYSRLADESQEATKREKVKSKYRKKAEKLKISESQFDNMLGVAFGNKKY